MATDEEEEEEERRDEEQLHLTLKVPWNWNIIWHGFWAAKGDDDDLE